ncbi:unnamed protein product [Citrullus colocynthis]|uniref:Uncharacterized protein n=1 Tax=Citrullus colocynthis TaxID=252529 RepID=A0ABP0XY26_9ROSI
MTMYLPLILLFFYSDHSSKQQKNRINVDQGALFVEFDGEIVEFNIFLCQIDIVDFVVHDTLLIPKTKDGFDDLPIVFSDFDNDFPAKNFDDLTSSQVPMLRLRPSPTTLSMFT